MLSQMRILSCAPGIAFLWNAAAAQQPRRLPVADSSAARIMAYARGHTGFNVVQAVLRQVGGPQPRSKLDELADSVTQMAFVAAPSPGQDPAGYASLALAEAGRREIFGVVGTPYEGALERLIRIHQATHSPSALSAMLRVTGRPRAIDYLFQIATSTDPSASYAMLNLTIDADSANRLPTATPAEREQTLARLHALWNEVDYSVPYLPGPRGTAGKPAVPDPGALGKLQYFAHQRGWTTY